MFSKRLAHGELGEQIVYRHLIGKDWLITGPYLAGKLAPPDVPHDYDFQAKKNNWLLCGDVKTKPARKYYPNLPQGIDLCYFRTYLKVYTVTPQVYDFLLFFVDEINRNIKALSFRSISDFARLVQEGKIKEEKSKGKTIIYFNDTLLTPIKKLSVDESNELASYTTRNYCYS